MCVWVEHPPGKEHPAVVLELPDGAVRVIMGTGTRRDRPHVFVLRRTAAGMAMRLSKDTYFYAGSDIIVLPSQCRVPDPQGRTPIATFAELRKIALRRP